MLLNIWKILHIVSLLCKGRYSVKHIASEHTLYSPLAFVTPQSVTNALITNRLRTPYGVFLTQKSYDSTADVQGPAGGWNNYTIFFFRNRIVPGEV